MILIYSCGYTRVSQTSDFIVFVYQPYLIKVDKSSRIHYNPVESIGIQ